MASDVANKEATFPWSLIHPQKCPYTTQNYLYCLAAKKGIHSVKWKGDPKNGVRTCAMLLCQFMVSEKNGPNYSTCTHSTSHTTPLTLCTNTSWFNMGSGDYYLLF